MKKSNLLLILFSFFLFNVFKLMPQNSKEDRTFAQITNTKIEFVIDTVSFKKEISQAIFSKQSNVQFDKIIINKKKVLEANDIFYCVMLYDFDKKLTTARVLNKINNKLYFTDSNYFEKLYISCKGKEKCNPNIAFVDNKLIWLCSDKIGECSINPEYDCKTFRSILNK